MFSFQCHWTDFSSCFPFEVLDKTWKASCKKTFNCAQSWPTKCNPMTCKSNHFKYSSLVWQEILLLYLFVKFESVLYVCWAPLGALRAVYMEGEGRSFNVKALWCIHWCFTIPTPRFDVEHYPLSQRLVWKFYQNELSNIVRNVGPFEALLWCFTIPTPRFDVATIPTIPTLPQTEWTIFCLNFIPSSYLTLNSTYFFVSKTLGMI